MLWAQLLCVLIFAVEILTRVASDEDADKRVIGVLVSVLFALIYACAGTYSHIIGWPH